MVKCEESDNAKRENKCFERRGVEKRKEATDAVQTENGLIRLVTFFLFRVLFT